MKKDNIKADQKRGWIPPRFQRLQAGAAESQRGTTADGGGGFQGS